MPIPPRAPEERLKQLFPPIVPLNPDKQTFELGLVLGGTVSAGAYTAGALDFLLEALEAWHGGEQAPLHKVVIKTAGGSSGGAVCSAILGLLSSRRVPHINADPLPPDPNNVNPYGERTGNPLWDLWVNGFRIEPLLSNGDIEANQDADAGTGANMPKVQHVPALLNCALIDEEGAKLAEFGQTPGNPLPYFAAPFRIAVTVANMRGIPYDIQGIPIIKADPNKPSATMVGAFTGADYVQHDDFTSFAFPNGASPTPNGDYLGKREDEFWLDPAQHGSGFVGYDTLVSFATASGAMPVGLAARALSRPPEHYWYRPRVRASVDAPGGYTIDWPDPDWNQLSDAENGSYSFTAVDGGTFNNDPVSLVHQAMMGIVGRNPKGKSDASRAILMIDPLSDQPQTIPPVGKSMLAVVENIVSTVVGGGRYLTADMELFADKDVFSRFQMVPNRPDPDNPDNGAKAKVGEAALAGTSLYAAAGWCARAYRVHDYLLGRYNMQTYIRRDLILAGDNPLFDRWSPDARADWAMDENGNRIAINAETPKSSYFLPILPDVTGGPLSLPAWPRNIYHPNSLNDMLRSRLDAVVKKLVSDNGGTGPLPWLLGVFAVPSVVDFVAGKITAEFNDELVQAGLVSAES